MRGLRGGESTILEQELVDTGETADVTRRAVRYRFDITPHHEDGTLDGLDEEIVLLSWDVVGVLDTDLHAGTNGTREDTTQGVEAALVGRRYHLGYIEAERALRIAVADGDGGLVVHGTLVEALDTVSLSGSGRGEVDDYHLQERVTSGEELAHDDLEECLAVEVTFFLGELDLELLEHGANGVLLGVHGGVEYLEDGIENEHVEGPLEWLAMSISVPCRPLLGRGVEKVVAPKLSHHLLLVDTELLGVTAGELAEGEGPSMQARGKSDSAPFWVDLDVTQGSVVEGGDGDIDVLNRATERLVKLLLADLKLEEGPVDLVDDDNGLDTLSQSLTKYRFGLYTDAIDTVDNDEGAIGNTESGSYFRGEIDVSRGVNQVDQKSTAYAGYQLCSTEVNITVNTFGLLLNCTNVLFIHLEVHRDSGRFDGDTTFFLVLPCIRESHFSSFGRSDDTGLGN